MNDNKIHSFIRPVDELSSSAKTIDGKVQKKSLLKAKGSKCKASNSCLIKVNNEFIDVETNAIKNSNLLDGMTVQILPGQEFKILIKPPITLSLNAFPRKNLFVGCPIIAVGENEYSDGVNYLWYRETFPSTKDYQFISSGLIYVPQSIDVGCKLKLYCTPWRNEESSISSLSPNSAGGKDCIIRGRTIVHYLTGVIE